MSRIWLRDTQPEHKGVHQVGWDQSEQDQAHNAATGPATQGLGSRGKRPGCSLLSSEGSIPLPCGINTHFLPLISSRGAVGGDTGEEKKKSLERKTHFLRQKKKIKSGLIKVNFTGERRERAKHNVLEISSARLRPRKQDKAASAVSAGVRRAGSGAGGVGYSLSRWEQTCWKTSSTEPSALSWVQRG